jgi:hypothetical protein
VEYKISLTPAGNRNRSLSLIAFSLYRYTDCVISLPSAMADTSKIFAADSQLSFHKY